MLILTCVRKRSRSRDISRSLFVIFGHIISTCCLTWSSQYPVFEVDTSLAFLIARLVTIVLSSRSASRLFLSPRHFGCDSPSYSPLLSLATTCFNRDFARDPPDAGAFLRADFRRLASSSVGTSSIRPLCGEDSADMDAALISDDQ